MVQNNKIVGALALIAGVLGMSVGGSAMALPEMQVGTRPPIVAPQSADTADSTVTEDVETEEQPNAS